MKSFAVGAVAAVLAFAGFSHDVHAQMLYGNGYGPSMMGSYGTEGASSTATATDAGDAAGAALWQKLSTGQAACSALTESDFAALGDYYMGNMMGAYHDQMDSYMTQSLGQQGDEAMHVAMGERLSGCNPQAAYPSGVTGFYPMMGGGWGMMNGWYGGMGYGFSPFGLLANALLWMLAVVGIVAIVRWLTHGRRQGS